MPKNDKNKDLKDTKNTEIERQKLIDEGGREVYGNKNSKKDDNVLIDSEH